jgi:hypothetical protein
VGAVDAADWVAVVGVTAYNKIGKSCDDWRWQRLCKEGCKGFGWVQFEATHSVTAKKAQSLVASADSIDRLSKCMVLLCSCRGCPIEKPRPTQCYKRADHLPSTTTVPLPVTATINQRHMWRAYFTEHKAHAKGPRHSWSPFAYGQQAQQWGWGSGFSIPRPPRCKTRRPLLIQHVPTTSQNHLRASYLYRLQPKQLQDPLPIQHVPTTADN